MGNKRLFQDYFKVVSSGFSKCFQGCFKRSSCDLGAFHRDFNF